MNVIRFVGRTMLGGYFMASGISAAMKPEEHVAKAEPILDKVTPLVQNVLPAEYADKIPSNKKTLVRMNGAALALGGAMMSLGIGRRLGAYLVAANYAPVLATRKPWGTEAERAQFLADAAILGGTLIASQDTQGKPSLAWRADAKRAELARSTERALASLKADASQASQKVSSTVSEVLPH